MKIREIMESTAGTTVSGGIATVPTAIGKVISRNPQSMLTGKYTNDPTPNTPDWMKKLKGKKSC